jgi:hypothetical protein
MRAFGYSLLVGVSLWAAGCELADFEAPRDSALTAEGHRGIYGGVQVTAADPVARSTVGFFSSSDYWTGHALIDGSGTLVAPGVIVGAAHTCLKFKPAFVYFGTNPPDETFYRSYSRYVGTSTYPGTRRVARCVVHPEYNSSASQGDPDVVAPNDIALFFVDSVPSGFVPAQVVDPAQTNLPSEVTIAGFGAYDDQWDNASTTGMLPHELRKVDSFLTQAWASSKQLMDGPNAGKGSCQGDSGGSVYARTNQSDVPVLLGIPVSGPECDKGIGYNTDVRYFVSWIEETAKVTLNKVRFDASPATCGNGTIDGVEACDGGFVACTELDSDKYGSGDAACNSSCSGYDTEGCELLPVMDSCVIAPCQSAASVNIPDNNVQGITSIIHVEAFSGALANAHVKVRITHTYRGDLHVMLTAPSGVSTVLHNKAGSSADNLDLDINLAAFGGPYPVGDWKLQVSDRASSDIGRLESWSLQLR